METVPMLSVYDQKPWQKAYPKWLPKTLAFSEETILDRFCDSVSRYPDDPCICYFSKTYSYKEINRMAAYKYPRIVEIIEEVPKTITGKFLRRKLRE